MTNIMNLGLTMSNKIMSVSLAQWDFSNFLKNSEQTLSTWAALAVSILGIVLLFVGLVRLVQALTSSGGQPANWFKIVALIIAGGVFMVGGWSFLSNIAGGGKQTIEDLGTGGGTILMDLQYLKAFIGTL